MNLVATRFGQANRSGPFANWRGVPTCSTLPQQSQFPARDAPELFEVGSLAKAIRPDGESKQKDCGQDCEPVQVHLQWRDHRLRAKPNEDSSGNQDDQIIPPALGACSSIQLISLLRQRHLLVIEIVTVAFTFDHFAGRMLLLL